jgi:O-antigen/teichoic acid export membrane protein
LETLMRAKWAWRTLGVKRKEAKWEINELRPVLKLTAIMSGAAWLGALTVQMDKIVLSRMVSIEQFGYYTIAAIVAAGTLQLIYPLIQALLPRAIHLRADDMALRRLIIKLVWAIGLITGLGSMIFIAAGNWLLHIWLKNPLVVEAVYPLLAILLVGTALNAFYNVGYIFWIANENTRKIFQVNALALILSVALIQPLVAWQGTLGAAFGWLAINSIGLIFSLEWIKQKKDEKVH